MNILVTFVVPIYTLRYLKINPLIEWLENHLLSCPTKSMTGIDCPGCGLQRSIIHLLKGEFAEAFIMYAPIYALILTIIVLITHLFVNSDKTRLILKYTYFTLASTILINFLIKFI